MPDPAPHTQRTPPTEDQRKAKSKRRARYKDRRSPFVYQVAATLADGKVVYSHTSGPYETLDRIRKLIHGGAVRLAVDRAVKPLER